MFGCYALPAWIGLIGAIVGGLIGLAGTWLQHHLATKKSSKLDELRKTVLRTMLSDNQYEWRNLDTLSHVIGADDETAKRLLLEVGARSSEDGQPKWALMSRKPLPSRP